MFREPEEEKEETASVRTLSDRLRTVKVRADPPIGIEMDREVNRAINTARFTGRLLVFLG